jgi:hypothetical protein
MNANIRTSMSKNLEPSLFFYCWIPIVLTLSFLLMGFYEKPSIPLLRSAALSLLWLPLSPLQLITTLSLPSVNSLFTSAPWYGELGVMIACWLIISLLKELFQELLLLRYCFTVFLVILTNIPLEQGFHWAFIAATWTPFTIGGTMVSVYVFIRYLVR